MDLFNLDGPLFKYGNMLADMVILSFLWIIFSLPLVTMGAASTAAYYVATRRIAEKEGYLIKDFWKAFRREFFKVTPIFIPIMVMVMVITIINLPQLNVTDAETMPLAANTVLTVLQYVLLVESLIVLMYMFPIAARFDMNRKELLKTAFFMANRHLLITIILVVILVGGSLTFLWLFGLLLLVFPGIYFYMSSYLFMRIFRKYRPDIDAMPGEANYIAPEVKEAEVSNARVEQSNNNGEGA